MKKFILGFILGTIIMVIAGKFWGLMPTFLGGIWDITTPNPITTANPLTPWCDKLDNNPSQLGSIKVSITQNGQPVSDLTICLSVKKPLLSTHLDAKPREFIMPTKACFVNTDAKGIGTFNKVPLGTAYLFFNNAPEAYPKRFGAPNFSITSVEVKQGEAMPIAIELNQPKQQ